MIRTRAIAAMVASTLAAAWMTVALADAASPLLTGREIAAQINARNQGQQATSTLLMELIDPRGLSRKRVTRSFRKRFDGEQRTVLFFTEPTNLKGTAFLTYDYDDPDRDDDQWLYLPAMRKLRRVAAAQRGDRFLGTDFTYDEIKRGGRVDVEMYEWKRVGAEEVDGNPCHVVEATPLASRLVDELGYARVRLWVDAALMLTRRFEFWDRAGELVKSVHVTDVRELDGIWTAQKLEARDHRTGHKTVLTVRDIDYHSEVDDTVFSEPALRRGI